MSLEAVDVVGGTVYVATQNSIRAVNPSTGEVSTLVQPGSGTPPCRAGPRGTAMLSAGSGMDSDGTYLYVADPNCFTVWQVSLATGATTALGNQQTPFSGVAYGPDGMLYAVDTVSPRVYQIDPKAPTQAPKVVYTLPSSGLNNFGGIAADATSLWVAQQDADQTGLCAEGLCSRLVEIDWSTGQSGMKTFDPPPGTSVSGFRNQLLDTKDFLYAVGLNGSSVQQDPKSGAAPVVLAGVASVPGYAPKGWVDGIGSNARFDAYASGIGTDGTSLWIGDGQNFRLRRIAAAPTGGSVTNSQLLGGTNAAMPCSCQAPSTSKHFTQWPVNAETGNFWHTFTDLSIPGRGLAINVQRSYNSDPSALAAAGLFGPGWSFSYGMNVTGIGTTTVTVNQENGATVSFTLSGGVYTPTSPQMIATLTAVGSTLVFQRQGRNSFTFDAASGQLISEKDVNGFVTTVSHPDPSRLVITDAGGRAVTANIAGGLIRSLTDASNPARTVATYNYDAAGNLAEVVDVNGGHTLFGYDSAHRMTTLRTPRFYGDTSTNPAHVVTNHYDSAGRVDWQTDQLGDKTSFDYASQPGSTTITEPPNANNVSNVVKQTYMGGLLVQETDGIDPSKTGSGSVWTYAFDPLTGGVSEITDPNGNRSFNYYDTQGNLLTHVDNAGNVTATTFNALNEPTTVVEPVVVNGVHPTTTNCYDNAGNIVSITRPDANTSCAAPNPNDTVFYHYHDANSGGQNGDVTSVVDQGGNTTHFTYDNFGDRTSVQLPATAENPAGDTTTYGFDTAKGWLTSAVAPKGNATGGTPAAYTTVYGHDPRGMVNATTDPLSHVTKTDYDPDGNVADTIDGDNNTTTYAYDAASRLIAATRPPSTAPTTTATSYWADGSIKDQTDAAGAVTHYTYNPITRVATVTDPNNRVTTNTYDALGDLISKQDPGGNCAATAKTGCTSYGYTVDNQPYTVTYSDGTTRNVTAIGYNANGQRTSMSDRGATAWAWTYDSAGRLTSVTDDNGQIVSYGYDTRNNLTAITYPGTAKTVTRDFDPAGRMDWVKDWNGNKTTVGYDANSNLTSQTTPTVTAPNIPGPNVVDSFAFDNADRMTSIFDQLTGAAQPFATFGYGYDNADQVNTTATGGTPGVPADNHSYGYTPINQLAAVDNGASGTNSYDKADNPTQLSSGITQTFDPANQICWTINGSVPNPTCSNRPADATTYGYDTRGNLTTVAAGGAATSSAFGYDQANRLTSVAADNAANFTPTAPTRIADTRPGSGKPYAGQTIGNAATLTIQVTGANGDGVPATATAVVLSVTAATSTQVTFLTAYPAGTSLPNTSALNVAAAGQVTDNQVTAKIGANGQVAIYNGHGNTDVVVDVMGYYSPVPSGAAGYTPVVPVRVADTRAGSGYQVAGQTLAAAQPTDVVQVTGANNIPASATAVVVDISAFNDPSSGYLVGYADGSTLPATANITYGNNVVVTKEATIPLAPNGAFDLTYGGGGTDMTVDIEGYYTGGTGSQYSPISPTRIADTRTSSGYPDAGQTIQAGGNLTVQVAGANGDGVPANATAVILNVTEVNATANSLFTVYPTGATRPTTTTVAFPAGTVAGNEVTVKLGTNGAVNIYNLYGHADAVVDVEGYFTPASQTTATYTYSGHGLRMAKTVNSTTQQMLWDQTGTIPLLLSDGTNDYIYGPQNLPLEQINNTTGTIGWYHHDQHGSTRALTNNTGTVISTTTYSPYGQATTTTGTPSPLAYDAQYTDPETGLIYLRNRYYDPTTAQFLTRDPLDAITRSAYGYVGGNPLNSTDPSGLFCLGDFCSQDVVAGVKAFFHGSSGGDCSTESSNTMFSCAVGHATTIVEHLLPAGIRGVPTECPELSTDPTDIGHADVHQYPGIQTGKSQFFDGENLSALSDTSGTQGTLQGNGNTRFVMRSSGPVGVDRTSGLPTDTYTVIRGPDGRVITIYPGTSPRS